MSPSENPPVCTRFSSCTDEVAVGPIQFQPAATAISAGAAVPLTVTVAVPAVDFFTA